MEMVKTSNAKYRSRCFGHEDALTTLRASYPRDRKLPCQQINPSTKEIRGHKSMPHKHLLTNMKRRKCPRIGSIGVCLLSALLPLYGFIMEMNETQFNRTSIMAAKGGLSNILRSQCTCAQFRSKSLNISLPLHSHHAIGFVVCSDSRHGPRGPVGSMYQNTSEISDSSSVYSILTSILSLSSILTC